MNDHLSTICEDHLFTNISNVSVNCVTPAIVALVIAKLTLETDVSFSILALFQKDL